MYNAFKKQQHVEHPSEGGVRYMHSFVVHMTRFLPASIYSLRRWLFKRKIRFRTPQH